MGSKVIKTCDNCGKDEKLPNRPVLILDIKRSDGLRTTGELCLDCLNRMAKDYGLTHTARQRRAGFKVTSLDEIERHPSA